MKPHLWQRAAAFAARAHEHQRRKDGRTPYFSHCARVAITLTTVFGCDDEAAIAAALLHDTIEDTTVDYDDVEHEFGAVVARCVAALTKNMILPEAAREKDYDRRLRDADWRARLIKLADAYDNFMDAGARGPDKVRKARRTCQRAIALAKPDNSARPATRQAIKALNAALKSR